MKQSRLYVPLLGCIISLMIFHVGFFDIPLSLCEATETNLDPNDFTLVGGGIARTSTQVTHTYDRTQESYLYKDYGVGYFTPSKNFELDFDIKESSVNAYRFWNPMGLANDLDGWYQVSGYEISVTLHYGSGEYDVYIRLAEYLDGSLQDPDNWDTDTTTLSQDTWYYCTYSEDGGNATLDVYSDAARTTSVLQLSITLNNPSYSYRYLYLAQSSEQGVGTEDPLGYSRNYVMRTGDLEYVNSLTETDRMIWTEVRYLSNVTTDHKLEYDLDPEFGSVDGSLWANSTDSPQFFIPNSAMTVNQTLYYRLTVSGHSETENITYSISAGDALDKGMCFPQTQFLGGSHDPPNAKGGRFIWVDPNTGKWTIKSGAGDSVGIWQSSDRGLNWVQVGDTLSANTDFPSGWTHAGSWGGFIYDGTYYWLILAGESDTDRGSFLYRGASLSSLEYYGKLVDSASGYSGLSKNCRCRSGWYNETDGHLWFVIGGATTTFGAWDRVYVVCDTDDDGTITDEVSSPQTRLIYSDADWDGGAWADAFIYPYHQVWWDWDNDQGISVVPACGSESPDYDFDVDLVFPSTNIPTGISYFYASSSSTRGYFGQWFDTGQPKSVGMTDIYDSCVIWENDGALFAKMVESATSGTTDPDAGDTWLGAIKGYWANELVGLDAGYSSINRYYTLPTETQFKNLLDIQLWTTRATNVTVDHLEGSAPIYAHFMINKTGGDFEMVALLNDLTSDTCYLHQSEETGYWDYEITNSSVDAYTTLTPSGSGDDFTFSFSMSEGATPTATTLEVTNPSDGAFIFVGTDLEYTLRMVGTDIDGGSDISTIHSSLVFDDVHRLNISVTGTTVSFPEGGDYVTHTKTTVSTLSTTKTVDVGLRFSENTPTVNALDGYLKVTDSSALSSEWTSFTDVISTVLYEDDGGGGGAPTSPPSGEDGGEEGEGEEPPPVIWWRDPPEYLIEIKNPLNPTQTINLIPIPWDWSRAQKMSSLFILWILLFLIMAYLYDELTEEVRDWKDSGTKTAEIRPPRVGLFKVEYSDPRARKKKRK